MNQRIAFQSLMEREVPPLPEPLIPRMPDLFEVARGMQVSPDLARLWREASTTQFPSLGFSATAVGALAMEFDCQRDADRARMTQWLITGRGTMSRRVSEFLRRSDFASPRAIREMQDVVWDKGTRLLDRLENLTSRPEYVARWAARNERGSMDSIKTLLYLLGGDRAADDSLGMCRVVDYAYASRRAFIEEPRESWEEAVMRGAEPPDELEGWWERDWLWPVNKFPEAPPDTTTTSG